MKIEKTKNTKNNKLTSVEKDEKKLNDFFNSKKKYIRSPILDLKKKVYITEEAYNLLRLEKIRQEKSMAQIVCNLILKEYKE
jgi:hypothetical protein